MPRTILIVDDDVALGRLYAEGLAPEGWRVLVERDGAAGLEAFRTRNVELVVLDAHLPTGAGGFEIAEQIRREPRGQDVPILFISGVYKAARHRAAVIDQFRAVDFLEKPVAPGELAARIRIALGPELPSPPPLPVEAPIVPTPAASPLPSFSVVFGGPLAPGAQRGDLSQKPFHEAFADLAKARATGLLAIRRDKVKKIVSLREGRPVGVKSNLLADCLGRLLVRAGTLTEEQCTQSLERMRAVGKPQGQVLVELGYLTPRTLEEALELQLEQKLFDVFSWDSGEFQFLPKVGDEAAQTVVEMSAARALHEGLARTCDETRLRRFLGSTGNRAARLHAEAAEAVASLANAQEIEPFAATLDGTRPLEEVLAVRMVPAVQALALVVTLKALGLAELVAPAPRKVQRVTRPPRRQFGPVDPGDPDGTGRLEERLEELSNATFYEVLDVPRSATTGEIKRAFLNAAREFHPDKHYAGAPTDIRTLAERIFDRYVQAHTVLGDRAERARYDAANPESPFDRAERILRGDEAFRRGRALFEQAQYGEAATQFREAAELYPEEAAFHAWHGLALWQATPDAPNAEKALALLDRSRQLHPRLAEAPLFASHIRRALGDEARAAEEWALAQVLSQPVAR